MKLAICLLLAAFARAAFVIPEFEEAELAGTKANLRTCFDSVITTQANSDSSAATWSKQTFEAVIFSLLQSVLRGTLGSEWLTVNLGAGKSEWLAEWLWRQHKPLAYRNICRSLIVSMNAYQAVKKWLYDDDWQKRAAVLAGVFTFTGRMVPESDVDKYNYFSKGDEETHLESKAHTAYDATCDFASTDATQLSPGITPAEFAASAQEVINKLTEVTDNFQVQRMVDDKNSVMLGAKDFFCGSDALRDAALANFVLKKIEQKLGSKDYWLWTKYGMEGAHYAEWYYNRYEGRKNDFQEEDWRKKLEELVKDKMVKNANNVGSKDKAKKAMDDFLTTETEFPALRDELWQKARSIRWMGEDAAEVQDFKKLAGEAWGQRANVAVDGYQTFGKDDYFNVVTALFDWMKDEKVREPVKKKALDNLAKRKLKDGELLDYYWSNFEKNWPNNDKQKLQPNLAPMVAQLLILHSPELLTEYGGPRYTKKSQPDIPWNKDNIGVLASADVAAFSDSDGSLKEAVRAAAKKDFLQEFKTRQDVEGEKNQAKKAALIEQKKKKTESKSGSQKLSNEYDSDVQKIQMNPVYGACKVFSQQLIDTMRPPKDFAEDLKKSAGCKRVVVL